MKRGKMTMAVAAQAVFNTAELLEAILLEMPPLDVLIYQRVSKNWRNGVQKSTAIQRALFLAPEDAKGLELEADGVTLKHLRKAYPLHARAYRPRTNSSRRFGASGFSKSDSRPSVILPSSITINPMLKPMFEFLDGHIYSCYGSLTSLCIPEASWKKMFFTQPPTRASLPWSRTSIIQAGELAGEIMNRKEDADLCSITFDTVRIEYTGELVFAPRRSLPAPGKIETLPEKNPNKLKPSKDEYVWDTEKQQWSRNGQIL